MILEEYLEIKVNGKAFQHYKNLGYEIKKNEPFLVKNIDLTNGSKVKEKIMCDECGLIYERKHCAIIDSRNRYGKDLCKNCSKKRQHEKIKETNSERYGVDYPLQSKEIKHKAEISTFEHYGKISYLGTEESKERARKISKEKYGVDFFSQALEIKEKIKNTNLKKYGVENVGQADEVKEKVRQTCLKKYGVSTSALVPEIREKMKETLLKNYGVDSVFKIPEIRKKGKDTLLKNNQILTSKQQIYVFNTIKKLFPNYIVELNYPIDELNLDIILIVSDNIKIDIEYDGWYWHQDKQKDRRRDEIVKKYGYKILRIKSGHLLPTEEQLKEAIEYLLNGHSFSQVILNDWKETIN